MRRLISDIVQPMGAVILAMHERGILIDRDEQKRQREAAQVQRDDAEARVLEVAARYVSVPTPPEVVACTKPKHEVVRRRSSCSVCMEAWGAISEFRKSRSYRKAVALTDFNVASREHKAWLLHEALGFAVTERTDTGLPRITAETLEAMREETEEGDERLPVLNALLALVDVEHLLNVDLDPPISADGRFHGMLTLEGTAIGRVRSGAVDADEDKADEEGFNELNIPKAARRLYVPDPGMAMVELDMAQIQWAALMLLARCRRGLEYYASGHDIHADNAAALIPVLFGRRWSGRGTPEGEKDRDVTKSVTHAADFGEGKRNLARRLGVKEAVAQAALNTYFAAWPEVLAHQGEVERTVIGERQLRTPFGRIRRFFDVTGAKRKGESVLTLDRKQRKQALQFGPAAIEADAMKIALRALYDEGFALLTSTYDSALMQVPVDTLGEDVERAMRIVSEPIPELAELNEGEAWGIRWEAKAGASWGSLEKRKKEAA